jgi:glycosyltransferase involved in cell wall biosynthesis
MARVLMIAYTTWVHDGRVKRHAQALAERGDQVEVICLENPEQGTSKGVNLIGIRMPKYRGASRTHYLRSYARFFITATIEALRRSMEKPYDLVIVCTMPDAAVLCAVPCKLFGSKIVLDIHDTMPELYRDKFRSRRGALGARVLQAVERASTWLADRVLAVHEPHRRRLAQAGVAADKIRVVINSPDPGIFAPQPYGKRRRTGFTLVCHGTITRRLGLDVAIEAVSLLRERLPDLRLRVIGAGDYLAEARSMVTRKGLTDRVTFEPPVRIERLPEILRDADAGLVPNRASAATHLMLPVKLLEYASLGLPIISARLGTIRHYFDQNAVRFFKSGNSADLASAIEGFYRDPRRRRAFAARAAAVVAQLGWPEQRARYYEAIDSLSGGSHLRMPEDRRPTRLAAG